jgi:hypothetical protein
MRALLVAALLAASLAASADKPRLPPNETYRSECGSCHVPYPPKLLPASSWHRLMADLDRHFGSDASLDAKAGDEISRYLARYAGRRAAPTGGEPRITQTAWFRKKHEVNTTANCAACHKGAENGNYSNHE